LARTSWAVSWAAPGSAPVAAAEKAPARLRAAVALVARAALTG